MAYYDCQDNDRTTATIYKCRDEGVADCLLLVHQIEVVTGLPLCPGEEPGLGVFGNNGISPGKHQRSAAVGVALATKRRPCPEHGESRCEC